MHRTPSPFLLIILLPMMPVSLRAAQLTASDSAARLVAAADSSFTLGTAEARARAIPQWQAAAVLYRRLGDLPAASRALQQVGRAFAGMSRFDSAIVSFQAVLDIHRARGDIEEQASQLVNLAGVNLRLSRLDTALQHLAQAQALAGQTRNDRLKSSVLMTMGGVAGMLGQTDSALALFRRALPFARAARDSVTESRILGNTALTFEITTHIDSAIFYSHASIAIKRRLRDEAGEASSLQNIGNAYRRLGQPDSSLIYLRRSLAMSERGSDPSRIGRTLGSIGTLFNDWGARDSASTYLRRSAVILRAIPDRQGLASVTHILGLVAQNLGMYDSALAYNRESLVMKREIGDRAGEGATLNNMALVFTELGQLDSALIYARLALAHRREYADPQGESHTLEALAVLYARRNQHDSALVFLHRSLAIAREAKSRLIESSQLNNIGNVFEAMGKADSALAYARAARGVASEVNDRDREASALQQIGKLHAAAGNALAARATFDSAAAVRSTLTRRAGPDFARTTLAERHTSLYEEWALLWSSVQASPVTSLAAAERGRAQALLDLMRDSSAGVEPGLDLAAEGRRLSAAVTGSGSGGLFYLMTRDTLLLWVAAPRGEVKLFRQPVPRDSVTARVGDLLTALGADESAALLAVRGLEAPGEPGGAARRSNRSGWTAPSEALARTLLPDAALAHLGSAPEVVIIPQGALAMVPFAALPSGAAGQPFGTQRAIRYAPSLATLEQAERRTKPAVARARTPQALVVGNPVMPDVTVTGGERSGLGSLPGAEAESRTVAMQLGAQALVGAQATETEVRRRLSTAPVVHLATHGFAYSAAAQALSSFVALAPDSLNDGLLTVGELLDDASLHLTADLIVLSACQTGLGNLKQAEGTLGLQRAFLAKGARSILVSLWSVSDEATRRLMEGFYAHWLGDRDRPSRAVALRRAQDAVRTTPGFEHPRHWAGFQLVGAR